MRSIARFAAGVAVVLVVMVGGATPGLAATGPNLKATAAWDQATYHLGDTAKLTVTLVNNGDATLHNVHTIGGDSIGVSAGTFVPALGFDLAAGASQTAVFTVTVVPAGFSHGLIGEGMEFAGDEADANVADNTAGAVARVLGGVGDTAGRFFDSAGGDSDSAPGVAGVTILLTNRLDTTVTAIGTTDATGAFHIANVPAGEYVPTVTPPPGWALGPDPLGLFQVLTENSPSVAVGLVKVPVQTTTTTPPPLAAPQLPTTGTPVGWIAAIGGVVLVSGAALLLLARRRRTAG
jgi:LPXTG-motif cell wall-anchored protein